ARGANSGIQDTDNLCWKLARVLRGESPDTLLASYDAERVEAADENILNSTRATDFITPKSAVSRTFRDAVLALSRQHPFARRLVNSGRLSMPTMHRASPLSTPDRSAFSGALVPGAPAADAPVQSAGRPGWLLDHLGGRFDLLLFDAEDDVAQRLAAGLGDAVRIVRITSSGAVKGQLIDFEGHAEHRYDGRPGTAYLLRPDQHVAARWRSASVDDVRAALWRAQGH
ncbi:MAG TPA: FAD-dependent monooxygenase, partial [Burkholderiaceae bacterium]|nr:FAD-dependent monooxygenase [Burkholderiaceae bacterium]